MPLQSGHLEQGLNDQINIYTSLQLHSIKKNNYTSNLENNICSKIKELGIKRIFRGKYRPKTCDQNRGVHSQLLKSLPKHNILYWKGKNTRFLLRNIQSIINKLDMVLHHMELENIDIGFITETWINNTRDRELITSQAKQVGYTIISQECINRKGGGLMCIYKSGFNVQKVRSILKKSFEGLIVRLQQTLFTLIYRPWYSKKNPVQMCTFLEEFADFLTSLLQENSQPIIIGDFNIPWN